MKSPAQRQGVEQVRHGRLRLFGVLAGVVLLAASCDWPLDRFGPDRTGYSASETAISPANVGQLAQQWTASLGGFGSDPVVADGHVFVTADSLPSNGKLYAFDASGNTNCTATPPKTCSPQWSASPPGPLFSAPGVNGGAVWIGAYGPAQGSMFAYNESTGAPTVSGGQGFPTSPAVTGNTVYASWSAEEPGGTFFNGLEAVDATTGASRFDAGLTNGTPADFGPAFTAPAVSNGTLYAASANTLYAFDATGTTNCGPPPSPLPNPFAGFSTICTPLWTATLSNAVNSNLFVVPGGANIMPAVANGYVYVGDSSGTLSAFPAGGCGAATCSPAWTAKTNGAIDSSPAVTPTTVFVSSSGGSLYAFPANGCGAATCQPLWQATTGAAVKSSPSVAGGVVYVGSDDDNLYAFNASGCGAAMCNPLLQTNVGAPVETSPAVANAQVFVTDTAGTLHAYGLPTTASS